MGYNAAENEAIGLCIALEAIDDMVNHSLLQVSTVAEYPGEAEVRFKSRVHEELFLARLLDFAKESGDYSLTGVKGSCLDLLASASETKSFDREDSVQSLTSAVAAAKQWLESETELKLWIPTLHIDAALKVPRVEFLYIAGNYAKHNLARLTGVSKRIASMLQQHGYTVSAEHIPLALEEFGDHLQEDYFVYYGTWLAELLNNLRWGIREYLLPVYRWSHRQTGECQYMYDYPPEVQGDVPRAWFWRLLNHVRRDPYVSRFQGTRYLRRSTLR